jgi:frataxin-like iron-binding protein CyaY
MIIRQDQRPNKMIWVTFRKEGMHRYPAAATDPTLATGDEYDVSFLANEHRHIFHFRVWIGVTHNDRDIEFIQFKRWLENLYKDAILSLDHKSCEMMSDDLYDVVSKKYPGREIWIEISEDGENGSFIKY